MVGSEELGGLNPPNPPINSNTAGVYAVILSITTSQNIFFSITTFETTKYAGILSICPWERPELLVRESWIVNVRYDRQICILGYIQIGCVVIFLLRIIACDLRMRRKNK